MNKQEKQLKKSYFENIQISTLLKSELKNSFDFTNLDFIDKFKLINQFKKFVDLVNDLGEIEHSSDWDLYLIIFLENNEKIITNNGYSVFNIDFKNELIIVENITDEEEEEEIKIKIKDIKKIILED